MVIKKCFIINSNRYLKSFHFSISLELYQHCSACGGDRHTPILLSRGPLEGTLASAIKLQVEYHSYEVLRTRDVSDFEFVCTFKYLHIDNELS